MTRLRRLIATYPNVKPTIEEVYSEWLQFRKDISQQIKLLQHSSGNTDQLTTTIEQKRDLLLESCARCDSVYLNGETNVSHVISNGISKLLDFLKK